MNKYLTQDGMDKYQKKLSVEYWITHQIREKSVDNNEKVRKNYPKDDF